MFFSTARILAFSALLFAGSSSAAPIEIQRRDVWVPQIFTPTTGTVWSVGSNQTVTWDLSQKPENVTNPTGMVLLRKNGSSDLENPLAKGFNLTDGQVNVTVPNVESADDYQIVLFGDSGNFSLNFTITATSGF
ncbi:hypothetical protein PNOK_0713900 [Pyrrhoderma noxium]|uniref:Yeast cell wall synthesis Kre9/Knh1-like N-terminal domain-containing protein n=1 Tax=Pyrrhoderma noxium TaxID=2282107 RepID=A0A286UC18_9AGAM|nr:hypothetical protein PNOK_0713900 [Pyrrhoderma noxium]